MRSGKWTSVPKYQQPPKRSTWVLPLGLATELLELLNHLVDLGLLKSKESIKLLASSLELGHLGGPRQLLNFLRTVCGLERSTPPLTCANAQNQ